MITQLGRRAVGVAAMTRTLTTTEAAHAAGVDPRLFRRWARAHNLEPLHRVRIGRSFVTVWSYDSLIAAA